MQVSALVVVSDCALQSGEGGGAVVVIDVAVIFVGDLRRAEGACRRLGDPVGQPHRVADGKDVFQAVPPSGPRPNVGEVELSRVWPWTGLLWFALQAHQLAVAVIKDRSALRASEAAADSEYSRPAGTVALAVAPGVTMRSSRFPSRARISQGRWP